MNTNDKFIGVVNEINQFLIEKYNLYEDATFGYAIENAKHLGDIEK